MQAAYIDSVALRHLETRNFPTRGGLQNLIMGHKAHKQSGVFNRTRTRLRRREAASRYEVPEKTKVEAPDGTDPHL